MEIEGIQTHHICDLWIQRLHYADLATTHKALNERLPSIATEIAEEVNGVKYPT